MPQWRNSSTLTRPIAPIVAAIACCALAVGLWLLGGNRPAAIATISRESANATPLAGEPKRIAADATTSAKSSTQPASAEARRDDNASEQHAAMVREWSADSPAEAAAWVRDYAVPAEREALLDQAILAWCENDPQAALAWTRQLSDGPAKTHTLATLAFEIARTDAITALTIASELPTSPERDDLCRHAASQWAVEDGHAAAQWADGITDRALREKVLTSILHSWETVDPKAAANFRNRGK